MNLRCQSICAWRTAMDRRGFLKCGAFAAAASAQATTAQTVATATAAASSPNAAHSPSRPADVLVHYTGDDHRRRLQNIAFCREHVGSCLRSHLITDYLPGQCVYNLGEYPAKKIWEPDDWDERELDALAAQGIELLQVHEEWNDSQRLFGSHKLAAANPAGFRRFVEMVHRRGMKLIVYVSSGYFERTDPDFRESWSGPGDLREIYFRYAHCSAANPEWRAYLLPHIVRILDDYGVDGIYNDLGYEQPGGPNRGRRRGARLPGGRRTRRRVGRLVAPDLRGGQAPWRHREGPSRRNDCPTDRTDGLRLLVGRRRGP